MNKKLFISIRYLSIAGIVLAIYLLFEQITQSPFRPCNINALVNCNAVISGTVAKTFGISTPLYGLIGYIVILFASIKMLRKLVLGMATFGLIFCLYIAYQELFLLHVICPICIACQVIMVTVFIMGLILVFGSRASKK